MMMTMKYQRGTAFEVFLMNERSVPLDHGCQAFMQHLLMTFIYGMLLLAMTSAEMLLVLRCSSTTCGTCTADETKGLRNISWSWCAIA